VAFDGSFYPNKRFDRRRKSVRHEFELAVRRYERYCAVIFKPGEPDALVELDVLHFDSFAPSSYRRKMLYQRQGEEYKIMIAYFFQCFQT
jgi:hypothetical protein